jgi:hypothetical protein
MFSARFVAMLARFCVGGRVTGMPWTRWTLYRMWLRTEERPFCPFLLYLSMMAWLDVGCVVLKAGKM